MLRRVQKAQQTSAAGQLTWSNLMRVNVAHLHQDPVYPVFKSLPHLCASSSQWMVMGVGMAALTTNEQRPAEDLGRLCLAPQRGTADAYSAISTAYCEAYSELLCFADVEADYDMRQFGSIWQLFSFG